MKKIFASVLFLSIASLTVFAQGDTDQPTVNPNAPKFDFENEIHNFGEVDEGPKYDYEFAFTNTGKEPLIIKNVRASCGCTTPEWPREPILPGQKAAIKAVYNSKGRPGQFNKSITISSNAETPTKILYIKGKVVKATEGGMPEKKPSMLSEPDGHEGHKH